MGSAVAHGDLPEAPWGRLTQHMMLGRGRRHISRAVLGMALIQAMCLQIAQHWRGHQPTDILAMC
jgi:hypothetical protein